MAENSKIEWTDHTFNAWRGCTKVSPGCSNCYAEKMSHRNPKVLGEWGPGATRVPASDSYWRQPIKWNRDAERDRVRRRVFCASLADVFDEEVPVEWRTRLFELIDDTRALDWLLLTKRPENALSYMQQYRDWLKNDWEPMVGESEEWPPPNVWLGVSVEDQKRADERIPILLQIPAAVRFLSVEPMIGPVDLSGGEDPYRSPKSYLSGEWDWIDEAAGVCRNAGIDWVIVGGESGNGARPCNVEWIRSIVRLCRAADVPVFVKQLGSHPCFRLEDEERRGNVMPSFHHSHGELFCKKLGDRKGGDWSQWPADLRIREFPKVLTEVKS